MSHFDFCLSTKSLYDGIQNDNLLGHTATVSTILKQGHSTRPELFLFQTCASNIEFKNNQRLINECLKNSKCSTKVDNFLLFRHIFVDGQPIECSYNFGMFLKEETDETKVQFGRIKLHYPITFEVEGFGLEINNRKVFESIRDYIGDYAFIVRKIELFDEPGKINFITSIIGERGIPYSKVFLDYKGDAEKKFTRVFNEVADSYDIEILALKHAIIPEDLIIDKVCPDTYPRIIDYCKEKALRIIQKRLLSNSNNRDIVFLSEMYPYGIYDFEYLVNGHKHYCLVQFTATNTDYLFLSSNKYNFISRHQETTEVVLVKKILSDNPILKYYSLGELDNSFNRDVAMIKYSK